MNCKGYVKATNKSLKSYEPNKPTLYIIYLGANSLYGQSMMQICPTNLLDWVNQRHFNLNENSNNSPTVFFLEVDLRYPNKFYDLYNNYPLEGKKLGKERICYPTSNYKSWKTIIFLMVKIKNLFPI